MATPQDVDALLRQLDDHRDAYLATFQQMHDLLTKQLASSTDSSGTTLPPSTQNGAVRPHSLGTEHKPRLSSSRFRHRKSSFGRHTQPASTASRGTGEDSDDDDCDYALYAHEPLQTQTYDDIMLRDHLMKHIWREGGKKILKGIIGVPTRITQPGLFPPKRGLAGDRSDLTHYQFWDVGDDGAPIAVGTESTEDLSTAMRIWNSLRTLNPATKEQKAVGRITIIREPSPALFAAIHLTHNKFFDMDHMFDELVESGGSTAVFNGAFDGDERRQRSFVFNLEYYTLIGDGCRPMSWQLADRKVKDNSYDIRISRCSSIVALSLQGTQIKKVKNSARRAEQSHGCAYDPFSPWQVLNVQAFPDLKSNGDVHDASKHYVNGVEAFLVTLLGEFRDALVRFEKLTEEIVRITRPPDDFMFDLKVRDRLQFEDEQYTYTRRYFWAYQTLGTIMASIKSMVDAYEDTFTEDVWQGNHKTIWPIMDETSPRNKYYRMRMDALRKKFEREIANFIKLRKEVYEHREEVVGLREELFVGTSIQESRNSVKNTEITIQQGHNIKLLTLVSIFFLPLTFVTSVFGMTNMPEERQYWHFGIVTATVCIPFFILIGSLNTVRGMTFWRKKTSNAFKHALNFFAWISGRPKNHAAWEAKKAIERRDSRRSTDPSADELKGSPAAIRLRRWSTNQKAEFEEKKLEEEESRDELGVGVAVRRPAEAYTRRSSIARLWTEEKAFGRGYGTKEEV
ncbi:uncharacterized protein RHO25_009713 [Cercospora beticola]|uniref:Uncharacterized protein n=1 Tax=Cercospora beticola TaxID=122368 RepID=A0ABZ0NZN9_CERBT|nr:hypothetical protein RHO25_009713 [Cercospora beticola]